MTNPTKGSYSVDPASQLVAAHGDVKLKTWGVLAVFVICVTLLVGFFAIAIAHPEMTEKVWGYVGPIIYTVVGGVVTNVFGGKK